MYIALNVGILEHATFVELELSRFNKLHHSRGLALMFIAGFLTYAYGVRNLQDIELSVLNLIYIAAEFNCIYT